MTNLEGLLLNLLFLLSTYTVFAQDVKNEPANISIGVYIPDSGSGIPSGSTILFANRLTQAITLNGIGSLSTRFVIIPSATILSSNSTLSAPIQYVCKVEVTIALLDVVEKLILSQCSLQLTGVDNSYEMAMNQAFNKFNSRSPELKRLISQGKDKITSYFINNCDEILTKAETLYKTKDFETALTLTTNIPDINSSCSFKAKELTLIIFKEFENNRCQQLLQLAKTEYAQQNFNNALTYLSLIHKNTPCFEEANSLTADIAKNHKEFINKIFDFEKENNNKQLDIIKAIINNKNSESVNYNWYINK